MFENYVRPKSRDKLYDHHYETQFVLLRESPETLLWLSVLSRAIEDYKMGVIDEFMTTQKLHYARTACQWVHSTHRGIMSFDWVCNKLFVHPEAVIEFFKQTMVISRIPYASTLEDDMRL